MKFKLKDTQKKAIKSYIRAVLASGVVLLLAIVGDIRPELALLVGALIGPLAKYLDPSETDFGIIAKKNLKKLKKK